MKIIVVTSTEIQNNFDKYLSLVMSGQVVIITKNGKEVAHLVPKDTAASCLTDSLSGIIKGSYDLDIEKEEGLIKKYGSYWRQCIMLKILLITPTELLTRL